MLRKQVRNWDVSGKGDGQVPVLYENVASEQGRDDDGERLAPGLFKKRSTHSTTSGVHLIN